MSRSLAWIGILTIAVAGATWKAMGDQEAAETTSGVVITNHLPDAERDRLMNEAMEKARKKLEAESGKKPDETYTEKKFNEETEKRKQAADENAKKAEAARKEVARKQAEEEKKKAKEEAAKRKAEEERLAKELAEAEKKASEAKKNDAEVKNLDTAEKTRETSKSSDNSTSKKSDRESNSGPVKKTESAKKTEESSKTESKKSEPETAIATVATNQPGARLTVKTTMPVGDDERRREMSEAQQSESSEGRRARGGSEDVSLEGQVVAIAPGPRPNRPNLVVTTEDRRTVQVEIPEGDNPIPGPGAIVTVRGQNVPGPGGQPIVRARSISIKNEIAEPRRPEPVPPHVAGAVAPIPPMPGPMIPPPGMLPPPVPMPPVIPAPPFAPPPF